MYLRIHKAFWFKKIKEALDLAKGKKDKGVVALLLLFVWLVFILLALLFYFYFFDKLKLPGSSDSADNKKITTEAEETVTYKMNDNLEINSLVIEYYTALALCDQKKLKSMVTDESKFDDMTSYERTAAKITNYRNVSCYTLPGMDDNSTVTYVTCNLTIEGVTSTPLNISRMYIVKQADGSYKIDNSEPSAELKSYLEKQDQNPDIQALYKAVTENINDALKNDESFAEFYNTIKQD